MTHRPSSAIKIICTFNIYGAICIDYHRLEARDFSERGVVWPWLAVHQEEADRSLRLVYPLEHIFVDACCILYDMIPGMCCVQVGCSCVVGTQKRGVFVIFRAPLRSSTPPCPSPALSALRPMMPITSPCPCIKTALNSPRGLIISHHNISLSSHSSSNHDEASSILHTI